MLQGLRRKHGSSAARLWCRVQAAVWSCREATRPPWRQLGGSNQLKSGVPPALCAGLEGGPERRQHLCSAAALGPEAHPSASPIRAPAACSERPASRPRRPHSASLPLKGESPALRIHESPPGTGWVPGSGSQGRCRLPGPTALLRGPCQGSRPLVAALQLQAEGLKHPPIAQCLA